MPAHEDQAVPSLVRQAAAWTWRLLLFLIAVIVALHVIKQLQVVVVSVALALLLTALLLPFVDWLHQHRVPRSAAVSLLLLSSMAVIGGILTFVITKFIQGMPRLVDIVKNWLSGPGQLKQQLEKVSHATIDALGKNEAKLTSGAVSTAATVGEIVTGAFIVLFTLIFFLYGGRNIYRFVTQIFPASVRERVRVAGIAGFGALIGYVRATLLVALVDAIGIGSGLAIMGVPLALPLASLVFLGAFIPLVGAVIAGFLAVVVALIAKGLFYALGTLILIIAVQQLEGHVLQPVVMGRAVSIHPLAVVLGIATGAVLGGIVGALLAVPLIAFVDRAVRVLLEPDAAAAKEEAAQEEPVVIRATPDSIG